jgi:hypothetical protein
MTDDVLEGVEWKLDCQGKQDFDDNLVFLSCRYYPRGGGFSTFTASPGGPVDWKHNEDRPEIKPTAYAGVYLRGMVLAELTVEGETEAEVKEQVERWARVQIESIYDLLLVAFKKRTPKGDL